MWAGSEGEVPGKGVLLHGVTIRGVTVRGFTVRGVFFKVSFQVLDQGQGELTRFLVRVWRGRPQGPFLSLHREGTLKAT